MLEHLIEHLNVIRSGRQRNSRPFAGLVNRDGHPGNQLLTQDTCCSLPFLLQARACDVGLFQHEDHAPDAVGTDNSGHLQEGSPQPASVPWFDQHLDNQVSRNGVSPKAGEFFDGLFK